MSEKKQEETGSVELNDYQKAFLKIEDEAKPLFDKISEVIGSFVNEDVNFDHSGLSKDEVYLKKWNTILKITYALGQVLGSLNSYFYDVKDKEMMAELDRKIDECEAMINSLCKPKITSIPCGNCSNCLAGDFDTCLNPVVRQEPSMFDLLEMDEVFVLSNTLLSMSTYLNSCRQIDIIKYEEENKKYGADTENSNT